MVGRGAREPIASVTAGSINEIDEPMEEEVFRMKKIALIALIVLAFQQRETINDFFNPPPDYAAAHGGKVILYATDWCGYCEKTRDYLASHRIPYHEYDIEKSAEGKRQFDELGGRGVPVVLVNGEVIKGYNPARITASLE